MVSRSSAETELQSLALGICESLWLKILLEELGMNIECPINSYYDNKATIVVSHNPMHHDRIKHVEIDKLFIKEKVDEVTLHIQYISSGEQIADILTKALFRPSFDRLIDKLGMYNLYRPRLRGGEIV